MGLGVKWGLGLMVLCLSGCQHIQTAPQPIPVSLTPTATQLARLAHKKECQALKEKADAGQMILPIKCHQPSAPSEPFFILEDWF